MGKTIFDPAGFKVIRKNLGSKKNLNCGDFVRVGALASLFSPCLLGGVLTEQESIDFVVFILSFPCINLCENVTLGADKAY